MLPTIFQVRPGRPQGPVGLRRMCLLKRPRILPALVSMIALLTVGCGNAKPTEPPPSEPTVIRLSVTAPEPFVTLGQSMQLVATAVMTSGGDRGVTDTASWTSSDADAVSVTATGVVTGRRSGSARISASFGGQSANLDVLVPSVAPQPRAVRLLYLAPQSREFRDDYERAIRGAFVDIQDWYGRQLGGAAFTIYSLEIERCRLTREVDFYLSDSYSKVLADAQRCLPVTAGQPPTAWVLYADVGHGCNLPGRLGVGSPGLTIMGQDDLQGLNDESQIHDGCQVVPKLTLGRWRGGAAHELGHAFGLPHPPGCDAGAPDCDRNALMWSGYTSYPNTYLRDEEKAALRASAFYPTLSPSLTMWDLSGLPPK